MVCSTFLACCPWDLSRPDYAVELVFESTDCFGARKPICEFLFSRALHYSWGNGSIQNIAALIGLRVLLAVWNVAALVESLAPHDASSDDQLARQRPAQLRGHPTPTQEPYSPSIHS